METKKDKKVNLYANILYLMQNTIILINTHTRTVLKSLLINLLASTLMSSAPSCEANINVSRVAILDHSARDAN